MTDAPKYTAPPTTKVDIHQFYQEYRDNLERATVDRDLALIAHKGAQRAYDLELAKRRALYLTRGVECEGGGRSRNPQLAQSLAYKETIELKESLDNARVLLDMYQACVKREIDREYIKNSRIT